MKFALIGDSHAQVIFPNLQKLLENDGHEVVLSKPKAGWTIEKHIDNGLELEMTNSDPDIVLYSLGGNNRDLDTNSYKKKIKKGIDIAKKSGAKKILWVSPFYSFDQEVEDRHRWTHLYLKNKSPILGIEYINLRETSKDGHTSDNVHFKNEKYREMANLIYNKIPKFVILPLTLQPYKPLIYLGCAFLFFKFINKGDKK